MSAGRKTAKYYCEYPIANLDQQGACAVVVSSSSTTRPRMLFNLQCLEHIMSTKKTVHGGGGSMLGNLDGTHRRCELHHNKEHGLAALELGVVRCLRALKASGVEPVYLASSSHKSHEEWSMWKFHDPASRPLCSSPRDSRARGGDITGHDMGKAISLATCYAAIPRVNGTATRR